LLEVVAKRFPRMVATFRESRYSRILTRPRSERRTAITRRDRLVALLAFAICALQIVRQPSFALADQAYPDSIEYITGAYNLAHGHGYVATLNGGVHATPLYPPGLSMLLMPFTFWHYPDGTFIAAKLLAVALLAAICWAAWMLRGPWAVVAAAAIVGLSPFVPALGRMVLTDPLDAALAVMILSVISRPATGRQFRRSGILAGASLLVRVAGVTTFASLVAAVGRRGLKAMLIGAVPLIAALAAYQWAANGSPLRTGYGYGAGHGIISVKNATSRTLSADSSFYLEDGLSRIRGPFVPTTGSPNATPNLLFYPDVLLGLGWVYAPPLVTVIGLIEAWRRRNSPAGRYVIASVLASLVLFTLYEYQAGRFLAPAASLLVVMSAAGLVDFLARFKPARYARQA
jgi:hypothetical protein